MKASAKPFAGLKERHACVQFDSPTEWLASLSPAAKSELDKALRDTSFYGGSQLSDLHSVMTVGKPDVAAKASAQSALIEAKLRDTKQRKRIKSEFGRVSVGAYLSSDPKPCKRRKTVQHPTAPVSIVVSVSSHWTVTGQELINRGVACAAMIKRVGAVRPVNLYLVRASRCYPEACLVTLVKIHTQPIALNTLAAILSDQAICRGLGFATLWDAHKHYKAAGMDLGTNPMGSQAIGPAGGEAYSQERHCEFQRDLEKFLGHEVLYVPGTYPDCKDWNLVRNDPVTWINQVCDQLGA